MSRSNPKSASPISRYYSWKGSEGALVYWDKAEEKEVIVEAPFKFLVLDNSYSTIAGWSDKDKAYYRSNEVNDLRTQEFVVRTSQGIKETGLYSELQVRNAGARYAKSIYIAVENADGELDIANLKATGAFLSAWIEFSKATDVDTGQVVITGTEEQKKGATKYFIPTFDQSDITDELDQMAIELDVVLQDYLKSRGSNVVSEVLAGAEDVSDDIEVGEIPF